MSTTLVMNNMRVSVPWDYEQTSSLGVNADFASSFTWLGSLASGTGAGNADKLYVNQITLAASATQTLDLNEASAAINDVFNNGLQFTKVRIIFVQLLSSTQNSISKSAAITVGGNTDALVNWIGTASDKVTIRNSPSGGCFFITAMDTTGFGVTAATACKLDITNTDGTNQAVVNVVIAGD